VLLGGEVIADRRCAGRAGRRHRGGHGLRRRVLAAGLMMRLLKTVSFTPYVIYRVILGAILLWLGYSGALTTV
jgi:undecaprenyl-diphosphatase